MIEMSAMVQTAKSTACPGKSPIPSNSDSSRRCEDRTPVPPEGRSIGAVLQGAVGREITAKAPIIMLIGGNHAH